MAATHDPLRQRKTLTPPPKTGRGNLPENAASLLGCGMILTRSLDCASLRSASLGMTGKYFRHPDRSAAEWRGLIMLLS